MAITVIMSKPLLHSDLELAESGRIFISSIGDFPIKVMMFIPS